MKASASSHIADSGSASFAVVVRDARSLAIFWDFPTSMEPGSTLRLLVSGGAHVETVLDLPSGRLVLAFPEAGQSYELSFGLHHEGGFTALSTQSVTLPPARPTKDREVARTDLASRRASVFLPQELVLAH